jgi:Ca-activated chloride channel family protein
MELAFARQHLDGRTHVMIRLPAATLVAAFALAVPSGTAGEEVRGRALPRFASDVDVVNLSVSVADSSRRYVTDLGKQDFTVLEDGVPQQVSVFDQQQAPVSVSILIDCSLSMQPIMATVQGAALRLVHALRPMDSAQIVRFNHRHSVVQEFTSDHGLLEAGIRSIRPEGATGLYNAVYLSLRELARRPADGELSKRAVVLLSDGADTTSLLNDDQVLDTARRAEVTVYAVGLGIAAAADSPMSDIGRARHFLTALTGETGGQPFFPRGLHELDGVYDRIARELSTQYSLGYVSSNARRDGKWRRVVVHSGRGGLVLRHRAGYFAAPATRIRATAPAREVTLTATRSTPN